MSLLVHRILSRCVLPAFQLILTSDPAVKYAHLAGERARVRDPFYDVEDDVASVASGGEGAVQPLAPIHHSMLGGCHAMWFV